MAKVRIGAFAAAALSTSLFYAVPAQADNSSDFLALISGEGLNVGDTAPDVEFTLTAGQRVCHVLHYGYPPDVAGRTVRYAFPNATPQQVAGFVQAAQAKLCALTYAPIEPGGY